ncbi:hypothetical protein BDR26DRAFT_851651 [Obelidium mucronatum]|nr:hypothetical protein BDR26DRAFT_851651 [Obelidium mucronatum]
MAPSTVKKRAAPANSETVPKKIKFADPEAEAEAAAETDAKPQPQAQAEPGTEKAAKKKRKRKGGAKKAAKKAAQLAQPTPKTQQPAPRDAAHAYLGAWAGDRAAWKFSKARQLWLLRHILDAWNIPAPLFANAAAYAAALPAGNARTLTLNKMKEVIVKGVTPAEEEEEEEEEGEEEDAKEKKDGAESSEAGKSDKKKKKRKKAAASDKNKEKKDIITQEMYDRALILVKALS